MSIKVKPVKSPDTASYCGQDLILHHSHDLHIVCTHIHDNFNIAFSVPYIAELFDLSIALTKAILNYLMFSGIARMQTIIPIGWTEEVTLYAIESGAIVDCYLYRDTK